MLLPTIFKRFSEREKILIALLMLIGIGIWANISFRWTRNLFQKKERIAEEIIYQNTLLLEAPLVKNVLETKINQVDKTRTLDPSHLVGRVDKLARLAGLVYELSTPKTIQGDLLNLHRVVISIRQATLGKLISFQASLQEDFPYLSLTNAKLSAVPSNPTLLDGNFSITAFELKSAFAESDSQPLPSS
jgi:hypothetical protein